MHAGGVEIWIYDGLLGNQFNLFLRSVLASRCRRLGGYQGPAEPALHASPKYRTDSVDSALVFCRRGLAGAYLPRFVAALHNETVGSQFQLVERRLDVQVRQDVVFLVKRDSMVATPAMRVVADALRHLLSR